jgi:hypothetical protein
MQLCTHCYGSKMEYLPDGRLFLWHSRKQKNEGEKSLNDSNSEESENSDGEEEEDGGSQSTQEAKQFSTFIITIDEVCTMSKN